MRLQRITRNCFYVYDEKGNIVLDAKFSGPLESLPNPTKLEIASAIADAMERLLESPVARKAALMPGLFDEVNG